MKKQNLKKQTGVSPLMGKSVGNKDINAAGCPIRSGMTEYYESGRSMVEMLGVLAIMGVLSVGGVAMYTTAMNKHRANEILNEASKRATIVAGQLLSNPEAKTMSLAQFGNNTVAGATFGENATIANNKITLTLTGVETNICAQMKAALGDNSAMAIDDTCATLTFNADMSRGVGAGGVSPSVDGPTEDDGSDCSGDTKLGGETSCQVCVQGAYIDSDAKCDADSVCVDGVCSDPLTGDGCAKNSDCEKGYFCNFNGSLNLDCEKGPTGKNGTCMEATFEKTTVDDDGIKGKLYTELMDWFSAKNFCAALGGSMISLKGSGINKSKLGSYFEDNGYCFGSDYEKCEEGVDWSVYKGKLASASWWTKDLTDNSCSAFLVTAGSSSVLGGSRNNGFAYPLCVSSPAF